MGECQRCGAPTITKTGGRPRKWCSERCRKRQYDLVCHICGGRCDGTTPSKVKDLNNPTCLSCTKNWARKDMAFRRSASERQRGQIVWADEEIVAAVRSIAVNGRANFNTYKTTYEAAPKGTMPSPALVVRRFDLWSGACRAAGLQTASGRSGAYSTRLTTEMCLLAVDDCWADIGRAPTYSEYSEWSRLTGSPSAESVRLRFPEHSWMDIIDAVSAGHPQADLEMAA